jgi:N-acetylneuraminic acid mutarotase
MASGPTAQIVATMTAQLSSNGTSGGVGGWRHIPNSGSKPKGRIGHTLVTHGDFAYVFGGVNDSLEPANQYFDDFHKYSPMTKTWTEIRLTGQPQTARAFHTAVFWNNCMWVFGGCNGRGRFNKLFTVGLDGTCTLIAPMTAPPNSRYCHSAVVYSDKMYVFAGKCGGRNSNRRLSDLFSYDFVANTWQPCLQFGSIPPPRSAHGCFVHGSTMLVFGGRNGEGECCEDLYEYQFASCVWTKIDLDCSAFGRARHSVALHNGRIIVFGGWNGKKKLNDLFYFSLDTFTFEVPPGSDEPDSAPPSRRECHNATTVNNVMVVFGGRFRGEFMEDVSELDLGSKSLKDCCRDWLLSGGVPFTDGRYGLPSTVVSYVRATEDTLQKAKELSMASKPQLTVLARPGAPPPPPSSGVQ